MTEATVTPQRRVKHAAPGQYLGYSLQPVRMCHHLLTCGKGDQVSLEYLDDVAVHGENGSVVLEQAKSALAHNPVSDWADEFWKCIANWFLLAASGAIDISNAHFRLYLTPPKPSNFAKLMSDAQTAEEVDCVTASIRAELKKKRKAPSCLPHMQRFLEAEPTNRFEIISRFRLIVEDDDPVGPLRCLLAPTVQPALIDPLCQFAIGSAKEMADRLIRAGKPALIDGDAFKGQFRSFVQKNNLPGYLAPLSLPPEQEIVVSVLSTSPVFIRQLDLIEVTEDERLRAVSDFLRSSADKSSWGEAGLIFPADLREWDDELVRRHTLIRGEVADVHGEKQPQVRGRILYRQCALMQPPLDGRTVPGHFVHGCLNSLADLKEIGWHPAFETLLAESSQ